MDNFRNYYELLGVSPKAQGDEIKKAFRRLARQYHPDLNPGNKIAEEKFKAIGEAYEVLADPDRRARYDQFSSYWQTQRQSADVQDLGNRDPNLDNDYGQFPDFNVFVDELLGRGMASPRRPNPDPPPQSWANSPREPMDPRGPRRSSAPPPPMDSPRGTPPRGTPPMISPGAIAPVAMLPLAIPCGITQGLIRFRGAHDPAATGLLAILPVAMAHPLDRHQPRPQTCP